MEEAYEELYQQFIRLRDICLQQAALLQRLTSAQGRPSASSTAPRADSGAPASIPVQCTERERRLIEGPFPQTPAVAAVTTAPPPGQTRRCSPGVGANGDDHCLLLERIPRLQLGTRQQAGVPDPTQLATVPHGPDGMGDNLMKRVTAPSGGAGWSPQADEWAGPSQFYNATGALCSTEANTEDQQTRAERISKMPWMMSSFLDSDLLSRGGLLLSEVTLNSQVCEFCQAVFPSDTTTRGEFLRHLTAHVT
nr:PREDICTED: uncharacterized protein LOC102691194 [Lepisosteus oculatus]XP_015199650.1 PREDICTED: uncharacterized protein LOC102691194 [Lepisosteus oculatus]XP_015199651.1 PREDICTED: uncharacterized protein LOC102691194 [Lepisosteus oculatus]XP_015199653.1 PREDICTED: uncharacterized protein LOC102691194 [Lepisosteus oculatus]XP_015199654.1 PREDICTED: uncharacterized protein LOC102691194 [Lepisosteus oculatus]